MPRRIIIIGGPHTGKTTLAGKLQSDLGIDTAYHSTDDLMDLGWSEQSEAASKWFSEPGDWIVEGVSSVRALRKWLNANPGAPLDAEILVLDKAFGPLKPGQVSMTKGIATVYLEIEPELTRRGARIQKLKNANCVIDLSRLHKPIPQDSGNREARQPMLRTYDKLEDVPEAMREHYKLIEGKYVPEVSDDHPVKVNNVKLLNEKTTAETKAGGLETQVASLKADLESAKVHSLPRGHKAVPTAEVEAMETLKAHGTAIEIVTKLTEYETLKDEAETRKTLDHLKKVAKILEYNEEAFSLIPGLPEFEVRVVDGKDTVIAKIKDDKGVITEKPASEFIESAPTIAPLLPALKTTQPGIRVPEQRRDSSSQSADDPITKRNLARDEARKTNPNPLMARPVVPGAQVPAAK